MRALICGAAAAAAVVTGALAAPEADRDAAAARAAVERALPLLTRSAVEYTRRRDCFSCHHQAMSVLALTTARARGFTIDSAALRLQAAHTLRDLENAREEYRQGRGQGGQATRAGYALWSLELAGTSPDATTEAVAGYLLRWNAAEGHWRTSARRPPSEASSFTSTAVALRGLRAFAPAEERERFEERTARVLAWLKATPARDTEDRVFRLWGLKLAGAGPEEVGAAARELRATQREDGGWSQLEGGQSDAYATGSALFALAQAGGADPGEASYRRGVRSLVASQRPDGSWWVSSRSKPFQEYFESGFPHGTDQFISMAAAGWATAALALACGQ